METITRSEFERLVERHYSDFLGRAINLCKDPVMAEDAVQNALLLAFEKMDKFEKRDPEMFEAQFRSWMYKIVAHVIYEMRARVGNRKPWQQKWTYVSFIYPDERRWPITIQTVDSLTAKPESDTDYIIKAIESLPKDSLHTYTGRMVPTRYVEIAKMSFMDEMSAAEIGNVLGLAENTVRTRLWRIRKILENKLR